MGHLRRATLLANALAKRYHIVFVMKDYPDGVSFIKELGYAIETIPDSDDGWEALIEPCRKHSPAKVIFDLYTNPYADFFGYARKENIRTIVFDVIGKCKGAPDILINDSLVEKFTTYPHLSSTTKRYLGPQYFLMDNPPARLPLKKSIRQVMITMGGSDPASLTVKIVRAVLEDRSPAQYRLNVVLGPLFNERDDILRMASSTEQRISVYHAPKNFLNLLNEQDIVICSAGRTVYECAYLGKPMILVPSIDHELSTAMEYESLTGCTNIGLWKEADGSPLHLLKALDKYEKSFTLRKSIHDAGRQLVNGEALHTICSIIETS